MGRFVEDRNTTLPEHSVMELPYQGRVDVFRNPVGGGYVMTLSNGKGADELTWSLAAITMPTAQREAMVLLRRWFAAAIAEFEFNMEMG